MRTYRIVCCESPDWPTIEKAPIDCYPWGGDYRPRAYGQCAFLPGRGLAVRLTAWEREPKAVYTANGDPVYKDSCLEFFLSAAECDARYLNIELNPNLCLYFGFGTGRVDRMRLLLPGGGKTLNACCERTATGWDVAYELPFKLLQLFFPDFSPSGKIRGNFYKCGDLTAQEHYLAWNRVDAGHPDFHLPAYFGELCFSD